MKDIDWNGTGLPPVGTICEVMGGGLLSSAFDWEPCTILLINAGAEGKPQVCTRDFRGDLAIYYPDVDSVYFRPTRTPEQIAADERKKAIDEMVSLIKYAHFSLIDTNLSPVEKANAYANELYEAGYRKQETPE